MKFYDNKYVRRIIAGATGLVLAASNVGVAKATANNEEPISLTTIILERQPVKETMTFEDYAIIVKDAYNFLKSHGIDYDGMLQDVQCTVYLANIEYIYGTDLEQFLIKEGYILKNDLTLIGEPGSYIQNAEGWFNVNAADRLIDQINDYNHKKLSIKDDQLVNTGIDNMFNISVFFKDNHDYNQTNIIYENLTSFGNSLSTNGNIELEEGLEEEYYIAQDAITGSAQASNDILTSLNSGGTNNNLSNLSVGAGWLNLRINGTTHMHFITMYLDAKYSNKELSKYFNRDLLNLGTFYIDGTKTIDADEISDPMLGYFVGQFAQMQRFAYDTPANELFNLLGKRCITREEAEVIYGGKSK